MNFYYFKRAAACSLDWLTQFDLTYYWAILNNGFLDKGQLDRRVAQTSYGRGSDWLIELIGLDFTDESSESAGREGKEGVATGEWLLVLRERRYANIYFLYKVQKY